VGASALRPRPAKISEKNPGPAPQKLNDEELLKQILDNPNLPSAPAVALQIVDLVSDPDSSIKDIVELLKMDPAICAKLLKTVNSCLYGLRSPVVLVERAVSIVGFHPLRSIVLGLAIPAMQKRGEPDPGLRSFWRESVSGAMMARELAIRFKDPQAEEVFLSGLLRDLGMTILKQQFGKRYDPAWCVGNEMWNQMWGQRQCLWEREEFGIDHAQLTAGLLARWHLPDEIVLPVKYHHTTQGIESLNSRIRNRIKLLDFCSRMARIENVAEDAEALQEVLEIAESDYHMSIQDLERFLSEVCPKIDAFAEILDIDIGSCAHFAEVMSAGCTAMANISLEMSISQTMHDAQENSSDTQKIRGKGTNNSSVNLDRAFAVTPPYSLSFIERLGQPGFHCTVQNYEVKEILGRGGMGVVLKAYEPSLDRHVALKMMTPNLADNPKARDRFVHEARTAAAILHENVVTIFTIGKFQGVSFLVMEYVDGQSIQDHHKAGRRFKAGEIVRIGRECAQGLAAAHQLGIIHRDMKPGNILLRRGNERAQIIDFGLACVMREQGAESSPESIWGTPEYMSPEQCQGDAFDCATDLYSLGGTLFAMCTGLHPLPWMVRRERRLEPIDQGIRRANPDIPPELARLVAKLMSPLPRERFLSAESTAQALAALDGKFR
jgi:HD-like signal output (HDOD) protein/predicted Ser/Thr protein kinase